MLFYLMVYFKFEVNHDRSSFFPPFPFSFLSECLPRVLVLNFSVFRCLSALKSTDSLSFVFFGYAIIDRIVFASSFLVHKRNYHRASCRGTSLHIQRHVVVLSCSDYSKWKVHDIEESQSFIFVGKHVPLTVFHVYETHDARLRTATKGLYHRSISRP